MKLFVIACKMSCFVVAMMAGCKYTGNLCQISRHRMGHEKWLVRLKEEDGKPIRRRANYGKHERARDRCRIFIKLRSERESGIISILKLCM